MSRSSTGERIMTDEHSKRTAECPICGTEVSLTENLASL
jgi:endogenous inhibitor of DNA gyrase (YacG/DUF329 family)